MDLDLTVGNAPGLNSYRGWLFRSDPLNPDQTVTGVGDRWRQSNGGGTRRSTTASGGGTPAKLENYSTDPQTTHEHHWKIEGDTGNTSVVSTEAKHRRRGGATRRGGSAPASFLTGIYWVLKDTTQRCKSVLTCLAAIATRSEQRRING